MFEPISYSLSQLAGFAILGFFLGLFYEPLRIVRLFKKQGVFLVAVQDFIFLCVAGFITFAYSLELGSGQFRFFFIAGEVFGVAVYFLTAGRLISFCSDIIVRIIKAVLRAFRRYLVTPIIKLLHNFGIALGKLLGKLHNFVTKLTKNVHKHLKKYINISYNKTVSKEKTPKGQTKNVIKAKITKKTY